MELTAIALFLASAPQALENLLDFTTIDGLRVSHLEGAAALRNGHAILVGDLLVGTFGANTLANYPSYAA